MYGEFWGWIILVLTTLQPLNYCKICRSVRSMAQRHGPGSVRLWRTRHHGSVRGIPWPEKGSAPAAQEANMEGENVQGNYVYWLVASTPLKNHGVRTSWDDYFQYIYIYGK